MSDGDEDDEGEEELDDEAKAFVEELRGAAQQKLDADRAMAKLMAARGTERDLGESSGDDDYNGSEEQGDYDDDSEEEGDYDDDAKEEVRRLVEELKQQKAAGRRRPRTAGLWRSRWRPAARPRPPSASLGCARTAAR